ncbi:MAG: c-type cytochrome [Planctomycetes bacterium]|nr:c-type cytochrome [Planctomycetota bacterium]
MTAPSPVTTLRIRPTLPWAGLLAYLGACSGGTAPAAPTAPPPVVAGVEMPGIGERVRGMVLLGELGCVACHSEPRQPARIDVRVGPDLRSVASRVRADHLLAFLRDPRHTEPGTAMPDLFGERDAAARDAAAGSLLAYLQTFSPAIELEAGPVEDAAAARGRVLFATIGCAVCHAPRDEQGRELPLAASVPLGRVQDKYTLTSMRTFLLAPHAARPAARMPDPHLSPGEAHDLASFLMLGARPDLAAPSPAAPGDAQVGRQLFAELGCANCHDLPDASRPAARRAASLDALDVGRGCLSTTPGAPPRYSLAEAQRRALATAIGQLAQPFDSEAQVQQLLVSRNCLACHARGDVGGVTAARDELFTSSDPNLGSEARLPPPLTGVGAKLRRDWLVEAIAHGQTARPYVRTRMPGFGAALAGRLAELLEGLDSLPPLQVAALPDDDKARRAVLDLGRELVGDKGMNCITCHRFAGEQVGAMGAIDLVESTGQRLRPQWFAHFLRAPFTFKPNTLMPQFFPNGTSTRPELGDGDVARQIDAMWHYLAEGRNVRQPSGMRRPPIELTVADEAVVLRRSVQHTGKRGISVGYPGGVNVTFDAKRLGLNQIWWGQFVDASPVWTGQGSGQARILGRRRAELPNGPAIVALAEPDAPWPEVSRRELGQRWLGYDLDPQQRPTFRYECAGVEVSDTLHEQFLSSLPGTTLQRTLRCSGEGDADLQLLAARGARIEQVEAGVVRVGDSLWLRLQPATCRILERGDTKELRVPIALRGGRAEVQIDYSWIEERK